MKDEYIQELEEGNEILESKLKKIKDIAWNENRPVTDRLWEVKKIIKEQ